MTAQHENLFREIQAQITKQGFSTSQDAQQQQQQRNVLRIALHSLGELFFLQMVNAFTVNS